MKPGKWFSILAVGILALLGSLAFAQGHGNGHDKDKHKDKHKDHEEAKGENSYGYSERDRNEMRGWYAENQRHLPPGLAKKDRLPPGLERQLVVRGKLPPGLEKRVYVVPVELERRLPPPPPDCERFLIGGHVVLRNRSTNIILDIFSF
jgi:hypothetical protein